MEIFVHSTKRTFMRSNTDVGLEGEIHPKGFVAPCRPVTFMFSRGYLFYNTDTSTFSFELTFGR